MNPSRSPAARPSQYLSEILPWGCGGAHGNRHLTPALGSCEWRRWDSPCRPRSRSAPSSGTRLLLGRPFEGPPHSAHTVGAGGVVTRPAGAAVEGELDADGVLAIDLVGDDGPALNEEVGRKGDHYAVGGLRLNVPRARLRGILIHSSPFPLCVLAQHSTGGNVNGPHGPSPRWLSSEELQGNEADTEKAREGTTDSIWLMRAAAKGAAAKKGAGLSSASGPPKRYPGSFWR